MDALNTALNINFPGAFPQTIHGGFFSCIELETIPSDKVELFVSKAAEAGVGIAPAWDAVAPDLREEKQNKGLLIRLTFPVYSADEVTWGISKLKQVLDSI